MDISVFFIIYIDRLVSLIFIFDICPMKTLTVRQNIIETASHLFYSNGYNLTGINEVIAEAGIAKATLYSHFKSKEELCVAYIQFMNSKFLKDLELFCKAKPKGNTQLLAIFDFLELFFKTEEFNGCWCIKTSAEIPRNNEKIRSEIQLQKNKFIELIESLITQNKIIDNADGTRGLAQQIYLLYEGAVSESHLHQDKWPIQSAKALVQKLI